MNRPHQDHDSVVNAPNKPRPKGPGPDDVKVGMHPHQDELLDEGVEETFPASDPVSVKRIT